MINFKEDKDLMPLNHSCAHMMAQAVKHLYPNAKFWVGPVIESGFYYDMDLGDVVVTDEIIANIEHEMKKIAKDGKRIVRKEVTKSEALEMFKDDPYKLDLINKMDEDNTTITTYTQGDYTDLCRGPHVESVKECKYFKLVKFSGAYWKGDSNNKVLQRIYGVCFRTEEELNAYLAELEEAKERDHRKIGKDLEIFMMSDLVGRGLPLWLPNGYTLWRILQNYITDKEVKNGYFHVHTPDLGSKELYVTSGHWDHYKDDMFPAMELDNETYVLRPMNCPHHMVIYGNKMHSYKELPIRIAEIANDFRYEAAGAVKGIERARSFTQNDSHIFCRQSQIESEFKNVLNLILEVYNDFGIDLVKTAKFRLSLRDENKAKYFDDDKMWNEAESDLRNVLNKLGINYVEAKGEAAFYGPKLDILIKPAIGNEVAIPTIQLDFLLPRRFNLSYTDEEGMKQTPVVIHRAILGSIDRFIAFLLEETKGNLPLWLAPVQVVVLPVKNEYHLEYSNEVVKKLEEAGIRVRLNDEDEKLSYRMREEQIKKIPIMLVLGNAERDEHKVTLRLHGDEQRTMDLDEFINFVKDKNDSKALEI
ncbi:MAG TPA: threonine--tRNA ligase [Bacilli bacterium]|nr:threonine--tRNA ligase [Bacilli bacterium]HPZ23758.1 threonine--tRNA ligase [Bacilli bacterium]HQC83757.1 threonine--tRNA ligase [Bacilli bacterium]